MGDTSTIELSLAATGTNTPLCVIDEDNVIVHSNAAFRTIVFDMTGGDGNPGDKVLRCFPHGSAAIWEDLFRKGRSGEITDATFRCRCRSGPKVYSVVFLASRDRGTLNLMFRDISEIHQAERRITRLASRFQAVLESSVDLNTSISDPEEIYHRLVEKLAAAIEFDTGTIQLLEGDTLHVVAQHGFEESPAVEELRFPLDNRFPNVRVVQTKRPLALADIRNDFPHFFLEEGEYVSGQIRSWLGVPIIDRGEVWGMVTLDRNRVDPFSADDIELATAIANHAGVAISNARLYAGLQRANAIQTTLMQELHHRVKNNMQLISSLISIRSGGFGRETQELLGEIRTRILALAAVHESLYRSPDLDIIDLADYLPRVIEEIEMGYRPGARGIAVRTTVAGEIRLHIDQAIPLGLLVSELVLNGVKHAFPADRLAVQPAGTAEISLAARQRAPGVLELSVSDNGIGLGATDTAESDSFGMVLIRTLCEQLDAEITHGDGDRRSVFGPGTQWKLHILEGGRT